MRTMRAAAIDAFGTADVLTVRDVPAPQVGASEVLVRVVNAGVQLTDAAVRAGWTPPGATVVFPQILGNEFSGIVEATGEGVTSFLPGDHVLGFRVLGCYAESVRVPAAQLISKPDNVEWATAGVLSASGQTAHTAVEQLRISTGDTVVVHGAAGGVGTVFVQLARDRGAQVIGTASAANHDYLHNLGVTPVEYGPHQLEQIRRSAPGGVDAVFDAAGHDNLLTAIELVGDRQRIATIVDMALANDLGCQIVRSDRSALRLADLAERVSRRTLKIHVRRTYPLEQAADAHRDVETGHGRGKIVLEIGEPG